ncbi:MAG: phosphoribosyl-AMP cyclohydrolase [Candidatus Omnitrophica bacterium]|nr:phosphoribosyl-AMP cyclohydrolase [Candidatus Omnitrophota bacterium]
MKKEEITITLDNLADLTFNKDGLIPAIAQDYETQEVLMMAYMNIDSLRETITGGKACYWSRSRQEYWVKGMTSGHFQHVKGIFYDCDCDTLLIKVEQIGSACHTMKRSCFYRSIDLPKNE